jgi:membrane-bound serine protease (ClpP class)
LSSNLAIIFFISLGFILFLIELLTPGFGIPGIAGIVFILIGCYNALKASLFLGIAASLASILTIILFFRIFAKSPVWRKIRLDTKEEKEKGFIPAEDLSYLLNKTGIAITALHPSGIALIEGKRIDVAAETMFIDKDKKIKVVEVEGNKVIVKEEL